VYPWLGCGQCRRCRAGDDNLCLSQRSLGVMQDGGFASHVVVPHPRYLVDPGDVDPAVAATFGCSGITVLSAIRKIMPMAPEDPVVLLGAGGLGLAAIAMLRALGHQAIISVDVNEEKRQAALTAGATAVVDGTVADVAGAIVKAAGEPVPAVIDFVNGSATARAALDALGKGGKMVQVGVFGGELNVSLIGLIFRAATIMGNNTGNLADLHEVARLARDGRLAAIPVTTLPKDQANAALMRLRDGGVTGRLVLTAEVVG
jgi:alcohol dehydrogenase/propanol-preferring alcohol dehydrogenase